jgi:hypothetical protein
MGEWRKVDLPTTFGIAQPVEDLNSGTDHLTSMHLLHHQREKAVPQNPSSSPLSSSTSVTTFQGRPRADAGMIAERVQSADSPFAIELWDHGSADPSLQRRRWTKKMALSLSALVLPRCLTDSFERSPLSFVGRRRRPSSHVPSRVLRRLHSVLPALSLSARTFSCLKPTLTQLHTLWRTSR